MKAFGNFKKKILILGDAPGEHEDRIGKPWQGKSGKLLQRTLRDLGIDLFEDCLSMNAVNCRPAKNRMPSNYEVDCCRRFVIKTIWEKKPKVIILLGAVALYSIIEHRWKRSFGGITKWRGWTIPDQDFSTWICPTFHPSFIERAEDGAEETVWRNDLKQAINLII